MPKKEVPVDHLQNYLPPGTSEPVINYLHQYKVHLTITRQRDSILGDYRHRTYDRNHRISVNSNLNKFSFLITLLHELAHLLCFEQHGNKVMAHGKEWKTIYGSLLKQFLGQQVFPPDIEKELMRTLKDPAASSCAEEGLIRVLRNYDERNGHHFIEELPAQSLFRVKDGRVFQKGEKLRKRFKCVELKTGKFYLFSPVYEVERVVRSR